MTALLLVMACADIGSPVPTVQVAVLGAEWCVPCKKLEKECKGMAGVGFVDFEKEPGKAKALWAGAERDAKDASGLPLTCPVFVTIVDGKPCRWFDVQPGKTMNRAAVVRLMLHPNGEKP